MFSWAGVWHSSDFIIKSPNLLLLKITKPFVFLRLPSEACPGFYHLVQIPFLRGSDKISSWANRTKRARIIFLHSPPKKICPGGGHNTQDGGRMSYHKKWETCFDSHVPYAFHKSFFIRCRKISFMPPLFDSSGAYALCTVYNFSLLIKLIDSDLW